MLACRNLAAVSAAAIASMAFAAAPAFAYPAAYYNTVSMGIPASDCAMAAYKALNAVGETAVQFFPKGSGEPVGVGGTTPADRGFAVCVPLPKAGTCGGEGATAVFVVAGDGADRLLNDILKNFQPPVVIDCSQ